MLWFLSMWLRKHPQDFCDSPDAVTVKRLVDYIRLNVPSTEVAMQTEELLSMLEKQESKNGCPGLEPELDPCRVWLHLFLAAGVQLGNPEPVSPLPGVDI
ncbi:ral guanine nucleotide dissociation stimulator-like [Microtus ochrogaster]|uniref:Ral guanine nucleotide dissociation stimulator-like n=1 Tax=Microtus ochrogaster TaxID=79684 RepID=A0ABM1AN98_MICOH|nr:ral guanine nucleotide dissociation stimulator-like [Microtus ochrogaster]